MKIARSRQGLAQRSIWREDLIKGCLVSSIVAKVKGQHKNLKSQCCNIKMSEDWWRDKYFQLFHLTSTSSLGNTLVFDFVKKLASPEIFYPEIWNPFWARDLAVIATLAPFLTASMARAAPIPVLAPVTQTTCIFSLTKTNVDAIWNLILKPSIQACSQFFPTQSWKISVTPVQEYKVPWLEEQAFSKSSNSNLLKYCFTHLTQPYTDDKE